MPSYCLLSWAGQRAPIDPLYSTCRSLNCHVVPALVSSLLASFEALRERKRKGATSTGPVARTKERWLWWLSKAKSKTSLQGGMPWGQSARARHNRSLTGA